MRPWRECPYCRGYGWQQGSRPGSIDPFWSAPYEPKKDTRKTNEKAGYPTRDCPVCKEIAESVDEAISAALLLCTGKSPDNFRKKVYALLKENER